MSILLPRFLATFKHAEAIATCREIRDAEDEVVSIDARRLVFVDPFALTLLGASPAHRLSQLLQYVLSELLENAVTHAQRHGFKGKARVWVAAQYYPTKDMVRLAVTDTGCGFLETLREHPDLGAQSHFSAILTAMKPRVSCNRDLGISSDTVNQGVGLTTVARIARLAEGRTLIVSGDAYHDPPGHGGRMPEASFWQGVSVAMELRRDRLQRVQIANALPEIETTRKVSPRFE